MATTTKTHEPRSNGRSPKTLDEAIDSLEKQVRAQGQSVSQAVLSEFEKVKTLVKEWAPKANQIKDDIEEHWNDKKEVVEKEIKDHPWVAVGVVGVVFLLIGWILGRSRN